MTLSFIRLPQLHSWSRTSKRISLTLQFKGECQARGFCFNVLHVEILDSTRGILESAQKLVGPALKRFVLLGSSVAVMNSFEREDVAGKDYTEKDWNPVRDSANRDFRDEQLSLYVGNS